MVVSFGNILRTILPQGNPQTEEEEEIQGIYQLCVGIFATISLGCWAYLAKFPLIDKFWPAKNLPENLEKDLDGRVKANVAKARATEQPDHVWKRSEKTEDEFVSRPWGMERERKTVITYRKKEDWSKVDGKAICNTHKDLLGKLENKRTACECGGALSLAAAAICTLVAACNYFSAGRYTEAPKIVMSMLCATAFVAISTFFWAKNNEAQRNYSVQKARVP